MTNEERKVIELALDWIEKQPEETPDSKYDVDTRYVVIRELEAVLAQPEQEPVKLVSYNCKCGRTMNFEFVHGVVAPQRTWVGLTDKEMYKLWLTVDEEANRMAFGKAVEAKLKEKNT